jgi:hypothetical protein
MFLLGNRYIEGMRKLAESSNAKMMVLPADIMAAVGAGLLIGSGDRVKRLYCC